MTSDNKAARQKSQLKVPRKATVSDLCAGSFDPLCRGALAGSLELITYSACQRAGAAGAPVRLQDGARFLVFEGIFGGRDAHEQRVVLGVFAAVAHEVGRGLGYLYPVDPGLDPELLHCASGLGQTARAFGRHPSHDGLQTLIPDAKSEW